MPGQVLLIPGGSGKVKSSLERYWRVVM